MYIPFDKMPEHSRIWIYQADKQLSEEEVEATEVACREFVTQWTAHQNQLEASYALLHNRFLILSVNEHSMGASGCSIDTSVRFVQELGIQLNTDFMNRKIAIETSSELELLSLQEIKKMAEEGLIESSDYYYNNLVPTKGELDNSWKIPVTKGWMSRYFKGNKEIAK